MNKYNEFFKAENPLIVAAYWQRKRKFLQGCGRSEATLAPVDGPTLLHIERAPSGFSGFQNRVC